MLKSFSMFRLPAALPPLATIESALAAHPFGPCGATDQATSGWVPPRGEAHGALVESVGGQLIALFKTETKKVPPAAVRRKVDEQVAAREAKGEKVGRKEKKEMKEDVLLSMLPSAIPAQATTLVWIDPEAKLLIVGTTSAKRSDTVISALVMVLPKFAVQAISTKKSPTAAMAEWLLAQEPPTGFTLGTACELKAIDDSKAVVTYGEHPLDIAEVSQHVKHGKLPTRLALAWGDRVSLVRGRPGRS